MGKGDRNKNFTVERPDNYFSVKISRLTSVKSGVNSRYIWNDVKRIAPCLWFSFQKLILSHYEENIKPNLKDILQSKWPVLLKIIKVIKCGNSEKHLVRKNLRRQHDILDGILRHKKTKSNKIWVKYTH